jgi:hypothetical protein
MCTIIIHLPDSPLDRLLRQVREADFAARGMPPQADRQLPPLQKMDPLALVVPDGLDIDPVREAKGDPLPIGSEGHPTRGRGDLCDLEWHLPVRPRNPQIFRTRFAGDRRTQKYPLPDRGVACQDRRPVTAQSSVIGFIVRQER